VERVQTGKKPGVKTETIPNTDTESFSGYPGDEILLLAMEQSSTAVIITDASGTIGYCNEEFIRLTGYSRAEVIGCNPRLFKSGEQTDAFYSEMWRTIALGIPWRGEFLNRRKDGSLYYESSVITPVTGTGGTITHYIAHKTDISAEYRLRKRLEVSEQRFRMIAEHTSDGILILNANGTAEYASPAYALQRGAEAGSVEGFTREDIYERIHPEDRDVLYTKIYDAIGRGESGITNWYRARIGADEYRWYEDRANFLYDEAGGHQKTIVVSRDITDRKEAEARLNAAARENEALLREVHHRVKNNLAVTTSLLSLQADKIESAEDARGALRASIGRIYTMAAAHEQLYEGGTLSRVDMKDYLTRVARQARNGVSRNGEVEFLIDVDNGSFDIESAVPCGLLVNELVSNAILHANPPDGRLRVDVGVHVDDQKKRVLSVRDNGRGLPENFETRVEHHLGFKLVSILTTQIGGVLRYGSGSGDESPGAWFSVTFPAE